MTAGLVLAFLAYLLVYAAVKNVHPFGPVVEAFGGKAPPAPGGSNVPAGTKVAEPSSSGGASLGGLTPAAARCKAAIEATYPNLTYQGGFECRTIIPHDGGTSSAWSEHAWGNAIDFGTKGQEVGMRKLVVWANLPHNKLRFKIAHVIPPGSAVATVHIDFLPSHTGATPPCAHP